MVLEVLRATFEVGGVGAMKRMHSRRVWESRVPGFGSATTLATRDWRHWTPDSRLCLWTPDSRLNEDSWLG